MSLYAWYVLIRPKLNVDSADVMWEVVTTNFRSHENWIFKRVMLIVPPRANWLIAWKSKDTKEATRGDEGSPRNQVPYLRLEIREGSKALAEVLEIDLPKLQKMKPKCIFGFTP